MSGLREVQSALVDAGYNPGRIDGVWGPRTAAALREALTAAQAAAQPARAPAGDADDAALIDELRADEGTVLHAYADSEGYLTIGTGRMIDRRRGGGISDAESDLLLANDLIRVAADLDRAIPWWRGLDAGRRRALRNLCFNMGWGNGTRGLSSFRNTLAALERGDFDAAADGFAGSRWARQVQASRRDRIVRQIRTGG